MLWVDSSFHSSCLAIISIKYSPHIVRPSKLKYFETFSYAIVLGVNLETSRSLDYYMWLNLPKIKVHTIFKVFCLTYLCTSQHSFTVSKIYNLSPWFCWIKINSPSSRENNINPFCDCLSPKFRWFFYWKILLRDNRSL